MRRLALVLAIVGCGHAKPAHRGSDSDTITEHKTFGEDENIPPPYEKAELDKTLAAERQALEAADKKRAELEETGDADQLRIATQDLAVRRRFVASLEVCAESNRACPPRLDDPAWSYDIASDADPKLDATMRFDLESWQKIAAELHGRACACRTIACVESLGIAIDRLEKRPMPDVLSDDTAGTSIARARACLMRLRGKRALPRPD